MYNEQLEQLIDAALADGVLTEKEKQILFKKAQAMGIDLDEFEMLLDARLVKLQKAEQEKAASSAPKSNKLGDVKKCPACGAMVQSYQGSCPMCGYAFEGIDANASAKKLSDMVDKMMQENINSTTSGFGFSYSNLQKEDDKRNRIREAIKTFPVPNTKSDLIEFILSLKPKSQEFGIYQDAYKTKYKECLEKARFIFPNDKDIQALLESNKLSWWARRSMLKKIFIIYGIIMVIAGIIIAITV